MQVTAWSGLTFISQHLIAASGRFWHSQVNFKSSQPAGAGGMQQQKNNSYMW